MTDDLVKRLREASGKYDEYCWHSDIELEAADRIEHLEYALRSIAETPIGAEILAIYMQETAKDALKEGKDEQGTQSANHRPVE